MKKMLNRFFYIILVIASILFWIYVLTFPIWFLDFMGVGTSGNYGNAELLPFLEISLVFIMNIWTLLRLKKGVWNNGN